MIDLEDKKAMLLINQKQKCDNLDELIVHELLHVKLYSLSQMIQNLLSIVYGEKRSGQREFAHIQFMSLLECTVEDLAKGYLSTVKSKKPLSFGRLKNSCNKELRNN